MVTSHVRFQRFAWATLGYTILVVLWGAYVRATGAGAGCGSHWPLCNGEVLPRAPRLETIIEFTHRVTSGVAGLAVAALFIWAWRAFPRGRRVRTAAALSLVFLIIEAMLGAGLVLFEYVARNASAGRAVYLSAHLINTQVLLALLAATAWFAARDGVWQGIPATLWVAIPVALAVGVTGAIAALGDTLFPAASVAAGVRAELSGSAHAILRLRLLHPAAAVSGGAYLLWIAFRERATLLGWLVAIQLAAGVINVLLLAPVWMQIAHLLLADLLWVALIVVLLDRGQSARFVMAEPIRSAEDKL